MVNIEMEAILKRVIFGLVIVILDSFSVGSTCRKMMTIEACRAFATQPITDCCYVSLQVGSGACRLFFWEEMERQGSSDALAKVRKAVLIDAGHRKSCLKLPRGYSTYQAYILDCACALLPEEVRLCAMFVTHSHDDHRNLIVPFLNAKITRDADFTLHLGGKESDYPQTWLSNLSCEYDSPSIQTYTFGSVEVHFNTFLKSHFADKAVDENSTGAIVCCMKKGKPLVTILGDIPGSAFELFHPIEIGTNFRNKSLNGIPELDILERYVNESLIIDASHHGLFDNGEWNVFCTLAREGRIFTVSGTPDGTFCIYSVVKSIFKALAKCYQHTFSLRCGDEIIPAPTKRRIFSTYDEGILCMEINSGNESIRIKGNLIPLST